MLDYGFANYETAVIAEAGQVMGTVEIERGTPTSVNAVTAEKITVLAAKGEKDAVKSKVIIRDTVPLPLKKGQKIGKVEVWQGKEKTAEYPLIAEKKVEKASFRELVSRLAKAAFS